MSMSSTPTISKPFVPGTTGWTVADLDDPATEQRWLAGRYEIVEGVLTTMPPAYFEGGNAAFNVMFLVKTYLNERGLRGRLSYEVDLVIDDARVARADAILMTPGDEQAQRDATRSDQRPSPGYTRIFVPPTLVIESISRGHEVHDRRTKMRWYAEYVVPNYWIIDAFQKSLECFILDKGDGYRLDQSGRDTDTVQPSLFEGLILPLNQIWTA